MDSEVTTYYLEMFDPAELRFKACPDPALRIEECRVKQFSYNRFLYQLVGESWQWTERLQWTEEQWRHYAESENLRTWVGYLGGSPAGYYELQKQADDNIEITNFGLAEPFIGRGLGGHLLSHAIRSAWEWGAKRVWVHTCTLDHPNALANYRARGMKLYKSVNSKKPTTSWRGPGPRLPE